MTDQRPHFAIPKEIIRSSPIRAVGRSKPFSRPNYSAHADFLREKVALAREYAARTAEADSVDSVFLAVTTPASLPAAGERQRLRNAGLEIVTLSALSPNAATVRISRSLLPSLDRKVAAYRSTASNRGKSYLSIIEDLGPVPLEEKVGALGASEQDQPTDCILQFYSTLSDAERAAVLFAVRSFMQRAALPLGEQRRLSNGVTLIEARLRPSEARVVGGAFTTLRQITPNHVFFVPDAWRISSLPSDLQIDAPTLKTVVAVVDTGVSASCPGLSGVVIDRRPHLPRGAVAAWPDHGTFVASRVAYGDDLETQLRAGVLRPLCPIVDVPVIGVDSKGSVMPVSEAQLASALDLLLPDVAHVARVVNLSLGTDSAIKDGSVSAVAQVIDKHASERDLLIVTTAGNIRDRRLLAAFPSSLQHPDTRIDAPGDAILAITVGSIAKREESSALSEPQMLSPFSRRGPGPYGGVKPDLVAHGGNCMPDGRTSAFIAPHGLVANGHAWACDYGTSFAAPLVAAIGARLFDHYENATSNLVRALLLHFADDVKCPEVGIPRKHLVGFGEPNVARASWAVPTAATFLHTGVLTASTFSFLPFLVPPCLASGSGGRLRIKATLVINPPVDPDNPVEYSRARMSVALRKPAEVGMSRIGMSEHVVNADKWWPITQLERSFTRSYTPGEWELQVRLWTRGLPAGFKQPFAAVVEVIDDFEAKPVYDEVATKAGAAFQICAIGRAA